MTGNVIPVISIRKTMACRESQTQKISRVRRSCAKPENSARHSAYATLGDVTQRLRRYIVRHYTVLVCCTTLCYAIRCKTLCYVRRRYTVL